MVCQSYFTKCSYYDHFCLFYRSLFFLFHMVLFPRVLLCLSFLLLHLFSSSNIFLTVYPGESQTCTSVHIIFELPALYSILFAINQYSLSTSACMCLLRKQRKTLEMQALTILPLKPLPHLTPILLSHNLFSLLPHTIIPILMWVLNLKKKTPL